jgi:NifU-like protein involved in Fe-S cluster formation
MLTADGPIPADPFHDFEVLHPAIQFKNRHASILLSLEATTEALELAQSAENTG